MMGLVGNVAEVRRLRNRLMKTEFITVFADLLASSSDGIEVIDSKVVIRIHFIYHFHLNVNLGELQCGWSFGPYCFGRSR